MPTVLCPACHEKGRIPDNFVGHNIRCGKCGNKFVVPAPNQATPSEGKPQPVVAKARTGSGIEVEGIDDATWTASAAQSESSSTPIDGVHDDHEAKFAVELHPSGEHKLYKVLTTKDKFFAGKFEFHRLEDAINHYAKQGWVVKGLATPQVVWFSGPSKEEIMILLEK